MDILSTLAVAAQSTDYSYKLIEAYRKYKAHDEYWEEVNCIVKMYLGVRQQPTPGTMSAGLVAWISISYVFRIPDEFETFTATAQSNAKGPISRYNGYKVLLPGHVMDRIDQGRSAAIADFQAFLRDE
ncbi:hypothetical protein BJX96DRAFT_44207 [Aspergillus floccosus]